MLLIIFCFREFNIISSNNNIQRNLWSLDINWNKLMFFRGFDIDVLKKSISFDFQNSIKMQILNLNTSFKNKCGITWDKDFALEVILEFFNSTATMRVKNDSWTKINFQTLKYIILILIFNYSTTEP